MPSKYQMPKSHSAINIIQSKKIKYITQRPSAANVHLYFLFTSFQSLGGVFFLAIGIHLHTIGCRFDSLTRFGSVTPQPLKEYRSVNSDIIKSPRESIWQICALRTFSRREVAGCRPLSPSGQNIRLELNNYCSRCLTLAWKWKDLPRSFTNYER